MRARLAALAVLLGAACNGNTYVVVRIAPAPAMAAVTSIELRLTLDGKAASTTLGESDHRAIALPTDATLQLGGGGGRLTITAIARDANDGEVDRGAATVDVATGGTTAVTVQLGAVSGSDGGVDAASSDGPQAAQLALSPAQLDFGPVTVGASTDQSLTVQNRGGTPTAPLAVALSGDQASDFTMTADDCTGMPLAPGSSCMLKLRFTPAATGPRSATLTVGGGGLSAGAPLAGTGLAPAQITITPATYDFGLVDAGKSAAQDFTIVNGGSVATGALAVAGIAAPFFIVTDGCSGKALAPNGSCVIRLAFNPPSYGAVFATLTVTGTPGGTAPAKLSATGRDTVTLDVTPTGTGMGTTTSPAAGSVSGGLSCPGTCSASYYRTTSAPSVVVTAMPNQGSGSVFAYWANGPCAGSASPSCTVLLDGPKSLSPRFDGPQPLTLTVVGPGSVSSPQGGIVNCPGTMNGNTCVASYTPGTMITLTATPTGGATFGGWSGDCAGFGKGDCALTMNQSHVAKATFNGPGCGQLPVDANTIGLYHLDDGQGQVVSDATNQHPGVLGKDAMVQPEDPKWTTGRFGGGLFFDVTNCNAMTNAGCQYWNVPANVSYPNGFSVELWIKPVAPYGNSGATSELWHPEGFSSFLEYGGGNGGTGFTFGVVDPTGQNWSYVSSATNVDNAWHYVAITWDNTYESLFVDGAMVGQTKQTSTHPAAATSQWNFGGRPFNVFLNGYLDEIRVSARARTAAEIQNYYATAKGCP